MGRTLRRGGRSGCGAIVCLSYQIGMGRGVRPGAVGDGRLAAFPYYDNDGWFAPARRSNARNAMPRRQRKTAQPEGLTRRVGAAIIALIRLAEVGGSYSRRKERSARISFFMAESVSSSAALRCGGICRPAPRQCGRRREPMAGQAIRIHPNAGNAMTRRQRETAKPEGLTKRVGATIIALIRLAEGGGSHSRRKKRPVRASFFRAESVSRSAALRCGGISRPALRQCGRRRWPTVGQAVRVHPKSHRATDGLSGQQVANR